MKKFFTFVAAALFAGSMMAADLLNIDFTQGQGEWTITDVQKDTLSFVWQQTANYGMKASAYTTAAHETESWLVSPDIDLTVAESAVLTINHAMNKGNNSTLAVMATTNGSDWNEVKLSQWPAGNNWNFLEATADLSAYAGKHIQLAFKYASSTSNCPTWEIKSVVIAEGEAPEPPAEADVVFTSAEFNGQGTSGTGSQVTATKDGVTFTCDMGFGDQYGVRCYKNSVVTISSANQQIGKIVFEFATVSSTYYNGGLDEEIVVNGMEWSAEGLASQARMNKISIYFGEYDPIVPQGPDTITVAQAVAIAEALAEPAENGQSTTDTKEYVVKGFAVQVYPKNDDGTWSFFMADKSGAYGPFSASNTSTDADVVENDFMLVRGKIAKRKTNAGKIQLQIYKGTGVHGQAPQGIENIILTEKVQKVIMDGVVYIVRDGKLFNLQGVQVR
ncbi:MAG: choice-of-anchor J domain-containing protein [Paludibacteraceae bacterium]|nr:choice-of-anchor J domain-containing protein [Paludibacteraceae bacterium]